MTPEEIEAHTKDRAERHDRMKRDMEHCLAQAADLKDYVMRHPLPWTWGMAYHDGWFYQFFDRNGDPCLGDDLRDPEYAAALLTMINR